MYMGLMILGRQKYRGEPLVPEPSAFEVELATEKLNCRKFPGIVQNPTVLIKAGGRRMR